MRQEITALLGLCFLAAAQSPAFAQQPIHIEPVRAYVKANILSWITDPQIVGALAFNNKLHSDLTDTAISELDEQWRAEFISEQRPLIESVLFSPLSAFLKEKQAQSNGVITEIFVIDAKGLSVGESEVSSDYWQGDEVKWQQTYLAGAGALFIDRAEKDESTQILQSQANMTISDPETGRPIGSITVGINLDAL